MFMSVLNTIIILLLAKSYLSTSAAFKKFRKEFNNNSRTCSVVELFRNSISLTLPAASNELMLAMRGTLSWSHHRSKKNIYIFLIS